MTQVSLQIQNEFFPGVIMPGISAGGVAPEAAEFAGRFAALLDRAGAVRETPPFAAETSFTPPESASFSPARDMDPLYDSRPPDAPPPFSAEADNAATDAADVDDVNNAEMSASPADDDGEAQALQDEGAEWAAQALSAQTSAAENAAARKTEIPEGGVIAEDGLARAERGREKAALPGEDDPARAETLPGLEEGVPVNLDTAQGSVITGEPEEADDAGREELRLARSGDSPARESLAERAEKPDGMIRSGAELAVSFEEAAAEEEAGKPGADLAGAETAALAPEGEGRGADLFREAASAGEALPENAAAELAALPKRERLRADAGTEKEGREEPGEVRKEGRRKDRFSLEARDFRVASRSDGGAGDAAKGGNAENNGGGSAPHHGQEQEIIVDLKSQARSQAEVSYSRESRGQLSFRDTLARELHENLNGDIVRHASVVLRNGGEGLIRLSLRPEHLGNVKIRLEMSENKVTGQIVVESGEALRAFEQELHSLEQAFRDSGFEGASLEMSIASDGGQGGAYREEGEDTPFFSDRLAAQSYDAASGDAVVTLLFEGGGRQVNVLA